MVFGTPCQISGFRNILEVYGWLDRVVLIDIFATGFPQICCGKIYGMGYKRNEIECSKNIKA